MIVEFIGSTGAGKTTLISEVQRRIADMAEVTTSFNLVAAPLGLSNMTHTTAKNLVQDLVGLPFFIGSLYRHKAFVIFVLNTLIRHKVRTVFTVNYLRSIVRKIGMYEIARRYGRDRIILVDEGTVLAAHLLFVYGSTSHSQEEIEEFTRLVPLPELVVYIKAPLDSLVQRSLQRTDPPREMRSMNQMLVEKYVGRAARMFDQLTEMKQIRDRILIVENPDSTKGERGDVEDQLAAFILNFASGGKQLSTIPTGGIEPVSVPSSAIEEKHVS